jgi:hypothetical protein
VRFPISKITRAKWTGDAQEKNSCFTSTTPVPTKEKRKHTWERIVSPINGTAKSGYLPAKE